MRLDKFLADQNIGTRSQVKELIKKGKVCVNDIIVKKADLQVNEKTDQILVEGVLVEQNQIHYIMLHKPAGVVTATEDKIEETVMDLLPDIFSKNFFPVGRLDKDTEGLLLITDDGQLAHRLLSPKKHVSKTYYLEIDGHLTNEQIELLKNGVDIGDEKPTFPAKVTEYKESGESASLLLSITEGRFHQIKRMIQACDLEVTYLKRLSMGTLELDKNLEKGAYRPLTNQEIIDLMNGRID